MHITSTDVFFLSHENIFLIHFSAKKLLSVALKCLQNTHLLFYSGIAILQLRFIVFSYTCFNSDHRMKLKFNIDYRKRIGGAMLEARWLWCRNFVALRRHV